MNEFFKSLKKYEIGIVVVSVIFIIITFTDFFPDNIFVKNVIQTLSTSLFVTIIVSAFSRYENIKSTAILDFANNYGLCGIYDHFPF